MWFALLIVTAFAATHWQLTIITAAVYAAYKLLEAADAAHKRRKAARRKAERRWIDNADREHRQIQQGSTNGIYGQYPIPDECRNIGIWIAD